MNPKLHSIAAAVKLVTLASAAVVLMSACDEGDAPTNSLPPGITQQGITAYTAVAIGAGTALPRKTC